MICRRLGRRRLLFFFPPVIFPLRFYILFLLLFSLLKLISFGALHHHSAVMHFDCKSIKFEEESIDKRVEPNRNANKKNGEILIIFIFFGQHPPIFKSWNIFSFYDLDCHSVWAV